MNDRGIQFSRKWVGAGTTQDLDAAERWWIQALHSTNNPRQGVEISRRVKAHLFSCLAASQWEKRIDKDNKTMWNIDAVERAGFFANEAASLGFISPTVLMVGAQMRQIMDAPIVPGVDYSGHLRRIKEFNFLFEVLDRRSQEVERERSRQDAKVAKAPNSYRCAAPGCGIEATKKSGLLRCSGKCPVELKPSYCSKGVSEGGKILLFLLRTQISNLIYVP